MDLELPLPPAEALGRALKAWRGLRRVKQSHAAELFGVSQGTVSRWEAGRQAPSAREAARLRALLGATPDGAADAAILQLVRSSTAPVHLVCDMSHRLLAASRARARAWRVPAESLQGTSLWRYASDDIRRAEQCLGERGWFEPDAAPVTLVTRPNRFAEVPIRAGRVRWTRLRLSDGSFARLVETLP
ncbi:MAG: helix-turn-helix transcriptional regulator [Proteobacteria bacterium]|nr:helix-turn-helix transcriptional regulator [Pseudomonadota bacterium]